MKSLECLFVVGPTASGKSRLAVELAEKLSAEIFNADSIQLYQGLTIGSAQPSRSLLERVPHHLYQVIERGQEVTAGDYRRLILQKLTDYASRGGQRAVLVGGSGFYLKALLSGMYEVEKPKPEVIERVAGLSDAQAYQALLQEDPEYGKKLPAKDQYRVRRALQSIWSSGESMTSIRARFAAKEIDFPYVHTIHGLSGDRAVLRSRVQLRTQEMLDQGLVSEVERLLDAGLGEWKALRSVGYKEVVAHLQGSLPKEELAAAITQSTMQLAKKQMTFFRGQLPVQWWELDVSSDHVLDSLNTSS